MDDWEYTSKITEDSLVGQQRKLLCSLCRRRTNHSIVKSLSDRWYVNNGEMAGETILLIVQCMGCELYSFCRESSDSENTEEYVDEEGVHRLVHPTTTEQFPVVNTGYEMYKTYFSMPKEIREAYEETYKALCSNMNKLGAAGARLIIELICLTNGIKRGKLDSKIDQLHKIGVVTSSMKDLLHNVRLFGNENLHTVKTPKVYELENAWTAINTLLDAIYGTQDSNSRYTIRPAF